MGLYKVRINKLKGELRKCKDKDEKKRLKRIIKEYKAIIKDSTRRD